MDGLQLLTSTQVGAMVGRTGPVSRQRVHQLRASYPDFPEPVFRAGRSDVWDRRDIEAWLKAHGRIDEED